MNARMLEIRLPSRGLVAITVASIVSASGGSVDASGSDSTLRAELERLGQRRIFFGHQSVGTNLLDGIAQLAAESGVSLRIVLAHTAGNVERATFGHTFLAENGKPMLKFQSFEQAMGPRDAGIDVAFMKLCYVDFGADTDAAVLFARYQAMIDRLRKTSPGTIFVHLTVPLTRVQAGVKALVKRLLGRPPYGVLENLRREEYNSLLRGAYEGREPIFDLARVESTALDRVAVTAPWNGNAVPAMDPEYTDDGGHLNALGRRRAARALIAVLAGIPQRPTGAAP
jgi:hypothetical protein